MHGIIRIKGRFPDIQFHDFGGYESRHASTLAMIRLALSLQSDKFQGRNFDFFIGSFDNPESCNDLAAQAPYVLTYSVTNACLPNVIAIPDFIFMGWPEAGIADYESCTAEMLSRGSTTPKYNKVFWIGNALMDPSRNVLLRIGQTRADVMDFVGMNWQREEKIGARHAADRYVSMPDHCEYAMLLDIRGAGYSGRLKLLLHARRPVFLVQHGFREFYTHLLQPHVHYIPVKGDLSDLEQRVGEVCAQPELAQKLAQNAAEFAQRFLSRDCAISHLSDVLLRISS
ncbi:MAG: hypothetical protein JO126_08115 [Alphaproteobacteria bacterium]|nr:hypothetical protein [Alphaproteobacteria bacterium]MBV8549405.1 hypothetical protein [Alphaproteobacteria bacterium]